jgi:hypothetical protein
MRKLDWPKILCWVSARRPSLDKIQPFFRRWYREAPEPNQTTLSSARYATG